MLTKVGEFLWLTVFYGMWLVLLALVQYTLVSEVVVLLGATDKSQIMAQEFVYTGSVYGVMALILINTGRLIYFARVLALFWALTILALMVIGCWSTFTADSVSGQDIYLTVMGVFTVAVFSWVGCVAWMLRDEIGAP